MTSNYDAVEAHISGERYGGKILSMISAPEGWFVGAQVKLYNRKTKETAYEEPKVSPLIAWVLVDAMFRDGSRATRIEPAFLDAAGIVTHESAFRWSEGAGDVDSDGWSTTVAVDVIPATGAVADIPAYGVAEAGLSEPGESST
jgi:hypothetical protein